MSETVEKRAARQDPAADLRRPVRILIPKTKDEVRDVYFSYDFKPYLLKRGVPIEVPLGLAKAMESTREVKYFKEVDERTQREVMVAQETQTVPFQYI